jgi:aspartate kinase
VVIIKFGGSVLEDVKSIGEAAESIRRLLREGRRVVVVVSALKGVTDQLIKMAQKVHPNPPAELMDELLSMGERTSARLFTTALLAKGIDAALLDPASPSWPLVTDNNHRDANPDMAATRERVERYLKPIIAAGKTVVVPGFVGITREGAVTTLGRGGSDTTAVVLGNALRASEVILAKDVETVYTSDPDRVDSPRPIDRLEPEEAYLLSAGGAKFLHAKALAYMGAGLRIRIASLEDLVAGGTLIDGEALPTLMIEPPVTGVSMITLVGTSSSPEAPKAVIEAVDAAKGEVLGVTTSGKAILIYVRNGQEVLNRLHQLVVESGIGKALTSYDGLAMVTIRGGMLETSPGMIQRVTAPLAAEKINIFGLVTITSSIRLFIDERVADRAVELLKEALLGDR